MIANPTRVAIEPLVKIASDVFNAFLGLVAAGVTTFGR
jgi:hypothetical protein